jgi:hypothetical protein
MNEKEFEEKARRHLFNSHLNVFPTVFEMYLRSFIKGYVDIESSMSDILNIIRTSADQKTAYELMCHYLDSLK